MLALWPNMVVVMLGPEFNSWPLRLQVRVMGMSPWDTTQVSWAKAPESMTSLPKENGTILGGSKTFQSKVFKTKKMSSAFPPTKIYH